MRYLRSPELALWAAVVVLLGALAVFAATRGHDAVRGGDPLAPVAAPGPASSQARTQVDALLALMPSGVAAGTDPSTLTAWSGAVADQAGQGTSIRKAEGAAASDAMLASFGRVGADAAQLRAHAADPVAATSLRTAVGLDVEHLHRLVLGQPAPELPQAGLDPLGSTRVLTPPVPPNPARPATPTLPEKK